MWPLKCNLFGSRAVTRLVNPTKGLFIWARLAGGRDAFISSSRGTHLPGMACLYGVDPARLVVYHGNFKCLLCEFLDISNVWFVSNASIKYIHKRNMIIRIVLRSRKRYVYQSVIPPSRDEAFIWEFLVPPRRDPGSCYRDSALPRRSGMHINMQYNLHYRRGLGSHAVPAKRGHINRP